MQGHGGALNPLQAADAGANQNAGAGAVVRAFRLPARVGYGLIGRSDSVNDEVVDFSLLFRLHAIVWVELPWGGPPGNEAANLASDIRYVKIGDAPGAAFTCEKV